jgi:hypothetical protein
MANATQRAVSTARASGAALNSEEYVMLIIREIRVIRVPSS